MGGLYSIICLFFKFFSKLIIEWILLISSVFYLDLSFAFDSNDSFFYQIICFVKFFQIVKTIFFYLNKKKNRKTMEALESFGEITKKSSILSRQSNKLERESTI